MNKKISEMNLNEKFDNFKKGVIEMTQQIFNGKYGELEQTIILGVKPQLIEVLLKKFEDKIDILNDTKEKIKKESADLDKIHVLPMNISKEISEIIRVIGNSPYAIQFAKERASEIIKERIDMFNSLLPFSVQFVAHVSEAYIVEKRISNQEKHDLDIGKKIKPVKDIELEIENNGSIENIPDSKEKVIILLEQINSTQLITFDIIRNKEVGYQEIINKEELPASNDPSQGLFSGFLHKQNIIN